MVHILHTVNPRGEIYEFEIGSPRPLSKAECDRLLLEESKKEEYWWKKDVVRTTSFFKRGVVPHHWLESSTGVKVGYPCKKVGGPRWHETPDFDNHAERYVQHLAWRLIEARPVSDAFKRVVSLLKAYGAFERSDNVAQCARRLIRWMRWEHPKLTKMVNLLETEYQEDEDCPGGLVSLHKGRRY